MYIIIFIGLNVIEVAHDMCSPVAKYVTGTLKVQNSYDTWHGIPFLCLYNS